MSDAPRAFDAIDDRAKAVFAAWFGMMSPGRGYLRFGMVESRPSDEAQAALDTLVAAEIIARHDEFGAVTYRPLVDGFPMMLWLRSRIDDPALRFPLTVPLTDKNPTGEITVSRPRRRRKNA